MKTSLNLKYTNNRKLGKHEKHEKLKIHINYNCYLIFVFIIDEFLVKNQIKFQDASEKWGKVAAADFGGLISYSV